MDFRNQYFVRRAEEEREAASEARHRKSQEIHLELSKRYEELSAVLESAREEGHGIVMGMIYVGERS